MHRERAGALEPALVAGSLEQLQEGVAVPGGAVTEAVPLLQRPRAACELAAGHEELGQRVVARCEARERRDDARRPVAPLRADLVGALGFLERGRPLRKPVL